MPWCPMCRYEYEPGVAQCSDCGAELVDELPPEAKLGEAIEVYRGTNLAAVEAVAGWLTDRGLSPQIIDRPAGVIMGASPAFAVTLDSETAEAIADDLEFAIAEIEAKLAIGTRNDDREEQSAG